MSFPTPDSSDMQECTQGEIYGEGIDDIAPQTREKFLVRLSSLTRLYDQHASSRDLVV